MGNAKSTKRLKRSKRSKKSKKTDATQNTDTNPESGGDLGSVAGAAEAEAVPKTAAVVARNQEVEAHLETLSTRLSEADIKALSSIWESNVQSKTENVSIIVFLCLSALFLATS